MEHLIDPVYNSESKILLLGSFPSVKSREVGFFYSHPQNRFWKVIATIAKEEVPVTIEDKKQLLLRHGIALWDVIQSCDIEGSSDSSIRNVVPADLSIILGRADIKQIYANGQKSHDLYKKYCLKQTGYDIVKLPSTSPANAGYSLERLLQQWYVIAQYVT